MSTFVLHSRSGPDAKLHLEVAVDRPDAEFEVEVVVRPKAAAPDLPSGYFQLLGSVNDDTLTIHPQPAMPPAIDME
jgi:hypothetical protein